jgi:hypothetical protein
MQSSVQSELGKTETELSHAVEEAKQSLEEKKPAA